MIQLKPCPFCGKSAAIEEIDGGYLGVRKSVGCSTETCQGYQATVTFSTHKEAAEAWNKRSDNHARAQGLRDAAEIVRNQCCTTCLDAILAEAKKLES
jgi:hypothetical protein